MRTARLMRKPVDAETNRHRSRKQWPALLALVGAAALLLCTPRIASAQQTAFAGMVTEMNCSAELMEPGAHAAKDLTLGRSGRRPLIDGEQLRCKGAGSMTVMFAEGRQTITKDKGWVEVHQGKILQKMAESFEPASTRGASLRETIFMSPPQDGAAEIQNLVVRWNPANLNGDVTLSLSAQGNDRELWRQAGYPGAKGSLDSEELRRALAAYRDRGASAPLLLRMRDSAGNTHVVSFSLLTPPTEEELQQMLAEWNSRDTLVRELGRASTYSAFGLFVEAAQEYESALREAPNSSLLLQLTAEAERRTGNSVRADELTQILERVVAKSG